MFKRAVSAAPYEDSLATEIVPLLSGPHVPRLTGLRETRRQLLHCWRQRRTPAEHSRSLLTGTFSPPRSKLSRSRQYRAPRGPATGGVRPAAGTALGTSRPESSMLARRQNMLQERGVPTPGGPQSPAEAP